MRAAVLCSVFLFFSSIPGTTGALPPRAGDHPTYRHAYYLFLAGTLSGCEDCYVPLLITAEPLEQVARAKRSEACVLIITYERDSIWHDDGIVSVEARDIEAAPRIVHLRSRKYRYQEIRSSEVLRLLENPMGTIPISRLRLPYVGPPGPTLEDLISAFGDTK
jgi:hypothetical protein